jgi:hypothetical protein
MFFFRVLDHDTYSAHDAIGKIYIDLNPLLARDTASSISGWFPLFDTMHGKYLNILYKNLKKNHKPYQCFRQGGEVGTSPPFHDARGACPFTLQSNVLKLPLFSLN